MSPKLRSTVIGAAALAALILAPVGPALAQPGGGGPFGGDRPNPFGVGRLLMSEEVRQEIELLDEQGEELRALQQEVGGQLRARMRGVMEEARDLPPEERRARFQAEMAAVRGDVEGRVQEILMPHQFERLRQIDLQQQLRTRGTGVLMQSGIVDQLGVTDQQREEMRAKAEEVQAELRQKIEQLRTEAREEVLSVLTSEQRAKLDALTGDEFQLEPQDRAFGGRRRGGFRGRGGPDGRGPDRDASRPELE